jgi:hypothetical protein
LTVEHLAPHWIEAPSPKRFFAICNSFLDFGLETNADEGFWIGLLGDAVLPMIDSMDEFGNRIRPRGQQMVLVKT